MRALNTLLRLSDALPTELTGHTVTTWKNMYLTVKVSSRKNVNIKQEKC